MSVAQWRACSSPRVMRATFVLCPSDIRGGVPCKYRASHLLACSPTPPRLYPLPVRRTNTLPAASFRSRIASGTLAVRLALPLAGCAEDSHLSSHRPTTTRVRIAPVTALRAMPGAPNKKPHVVGLIARPPHLSHRILGQELRTEPVRCSGRLVKEHSRDVPRMFNALCHNCEVYQCVE